MLKVETPQGERYSIPFSDFYDERTTDLTIRMGRGEANQISLPDPEKVISRIQCQFEFANGVWWLVDETSSNGTYIARASEEIEIDVRKDGRVSLDDDDVVTILGGWTDEETPLFWRMRWEDPGKTRPAPGRDGRFLEYDLAQKQICKVVRGQRVFIDLSDLELKLVDHLARADGVYCSAPDLIEVIWGDSFWHHVGEVQRLVWQLRRKLEDDSGQPRWLLNKRNQGYSLQVKRIE
ncbi:MAG: FHA domain-containing protein [Acaryochloridaceae cyanobacterium RL_2_7]|nr:FHA domain-containing protein [Acaryochloridaceae cyanobacterium RL_2_7]